MKPANPRTDPACPQVEEDLLNQFDQAWRSGHPPAIDDFHRRLSASGQHVDFEARRRFLEELVKTDLEYRWRLAGPFPPLAAAVAHRSECPRVEDYLACFPDLGPGDQLSIDLLAEEYWVRHFFGDRPPHADYQTRFPRHWEKLRQALGPIDAELASERRPAGIVPGKQNDMSQPDALREKLRSLGVVLASASGSFDFSTQAKAKPAEPMASVPALIDVLRQCELLTGPQLDELGHCQPGFADPLSLGRYLLQRDWLTAYQVNQMLQGRGGDLILGPYVLLERLGEGGAGQVFKARHLRMNRLVAVKVLRKELLADAEVLARFYREIQLVSQLNHTHIVRALDAGPLGQSHVLVMEYVEGIDLGRLVREYGPLPVPQACAYIRQAAVGLQHAHGQGLVHRDIKPNNLLVSGRVVSGRVVSGNQQGVPTTHHSPLTTHSVKILDFGLARLHRPGGGEPTTLITPTGGAAMLGTPDYLAPEQALDFHGADIRADIYSLGCTFYYLLTGQAPFASGTMAQKLLKHQQSAPHPVEKLRKDLPPQVAAVLRKMLAKRPEDRFQTPREVADALAPWTIPGAVGVPGSAQPPSHRHLLIWVGAFLALTAGWVWLSRGRTPSSMPAAGRPPEGQTSKATIDYLKPVPRGSASIDLAGREFYTAAKKRRGYDSASPVVIGDPEYSGASERPVVSLPWNFKDGAAVIDTGDVALPTKPPHQWSVHLQGDDEFRAVRFYFALAHQGARGKVDYRFQAGASHQALPMSASGNVLYEAGVSFRGSVTVQFGPEGELPGAFFTLAAVIVER